MSIRCDFLAAGLAVFSAALAMGAEAMTKEQMQSAIVSDSITIPTPGEFFSAMDEHGHPNWTQMFSPKSSVNTSSREQMALMLGVLVADGYLAAEAQDGQGVKNTGKEIINLTKKLGLVRENDEKSKGLLSRGTSLVAFAENNDWSTLREELEATQNEVKLSMIEQKDKDLVILVTVGAWVRGTQVAAEFISKNYSAGSAGVLRQPAIVEYLISGLGGLPEKLREGPLIAELRQKLGSVLPLVQTKDRAPVSPEAAKELAATMLALVNAISEGGRK